MIRPFFYKQLAANIVNYKGKWYRVISEIMPEIPTTAIKNTTTEVKLDYPAKYVGYALAICGLTYICEDANGSDLKIACKTNKFNPIVLKIATIETTISYEYGPFQLAQNYTLEFPELREDPILIEAGMAATFYLINANALSDISFRYIARMQVLQELLPDELQQLLEWVIA